MAHEFKRLNDAIVAATRELNRITEIMKEVHVRQKALGDVIIAHNKKYNIPMPPAASSKDIAKEKKEKVKTKNPLKLVP